MKSESVSLYVIGTELTRGIISDSHIPFLTSELSDLGYSVNRATIVPDDGSIEKGLEDIASDSDVILVTGGLGPTSDDMTRNIVAKLADVPLKRNGEAWEVLYGRIGERAYGANEIQVMIPEGFEIIPNPNGTACGFTGSFTKDGRQVVIICMPGPPAEMRPMFYNYVKPYLTKLIGKPEESRDEYSVFLIAEAKLEELCQKCAIDGVKWGTRFQTFSISLYITGSDNNKRELFINNLRELAGDGLIVDKDNVTAVSMLTDILIKDKLTISCAESCTCGLIAKLLTDQSGSSSYFWGGCATYDNTAKQALVNVKKETLEQFGAVSKEVAIQMAEGMNAVSGTDISVSVTGIAGPDGGSEEKPVGTIWIGFASKSKPSQAVKLLITAHNRDAFRRKFAVAAMILAKDYLAGKELIDTVSTWLYI